MRAALRRGLGRAWDFAMANGGKSNNSGKAGQRAARKARLAAALRENLKRRKRQARERAGAHQPPAAGVLSQDGAQHGAEDGSPDAQPSGGEPDFRRNRNEE